MSAHAVLRATPVREAQDCQSARSGPRDRSESAAPAPCPTAGVSAGPKATAPAPTPPFCLTAVACLPSVCVLKIRGFYLTVNNWRITLSHQTK